MIDSQFYQNNKSMKYLLSILCLFIFSCDSGGDDAVEVEGCTDINACNYGENSECYYFYPEELADDVDEYHCDDMQVLQDIIDANDSNDFIIKNVTDFFATGTDEQGQIVQYPYCYLSETGRIQYLYLYDSNISILPESIGNLISLEHLNIENNQLTSIPGSIEYLSNLTELGLFSNNLTSIPISLCNILDNEVPTYNYPDEIEIIDIMLWDNNLCEKYNYECFYEENVERFFWNGTSDEYPQDQSNCCEGVNDEGETVPNWITCP